MPEQYLRSGGSFRDPSATVLLFQSKMEVGEPNPFAPFSKKLNVEFTRAFDNAKLHLSVTC